jgi:antitoxin (DNA-binding transcriptional repressor) of toxin-antitoxin stability system
MIITVDGVAAAQIVPLDATSRAISIEELVAAGRLIAPRVAAPPTSPSPVRLEGVRPLSDIVAEQRQR